jgi:hypothetical protein
MVAELDPKDPKTGTDTSGSDAFNGLFTRLQGPSNGSTWVRGHLLNHDLGGIAHYNNLFPITTAANGEHYHEVEKQVKHWVANKNLVTYEVDAKKTGDDTTPSGEFVCNAKVAGYYGGGVDYSGEVIDKTIKSSPVKVAGTRHYSGGNVGTDKYSDVELGGTNTVFRDSYKGLKKDARWQHAGGTVDTNNQEVPAGITVQVGVKPEIAEHAPVLLNDDEVGNGDFDQDAIEEVIADQQ